MSWIETISESDADGPLARFYAACVDPESGRVDHVLRIHSLAPRGLRAHLHLYEHVMEGTATLPKVEREMLAVTVSRENGCHY